ncbi:MAG: M56 family metallopeptidase [Patescibacteria group bacterium]|nr:M56 family metallopeptidase [Patescibacteria group bacterium]
MMNLIKFRQQFYLGLLAISLPIFLLVAFLGGLKKIVGNWNIFFSFCSKTINFLFGFIFYYQNFWLILIVGGFAFYLFKGFTFILLQTFKLSRIKNRLNNSLSTSVVGLRGNLIVEDSRVYAFTTGFLQPKTYLSTGLLKKLAYEELVAVTTHEDFHRHNFHPLSLLLINSLRAFFSFLPLVKDVADFLGKRYEYQADVAALAFVSKRTLATALVKVLEIDNTIDLPIAVASFASNYRVDLLTSNQAPKLLFSKFWLVVSLTVFIGAVALTFSPSASRASTKIVNSGANNFYCFSSGESIMSLVSFGQSEALMTIDFSNK